MQHPIILSIDPGKTGAVVTMFGDEIKFFDTPVSNDGKKNRYDIRAMIEILEDNIGTMNAVAIIEDVHAMPGQGVTSMFDMGYGLGLWHMALSFLGVPIHRVTPQTWKKEFSLIGKEKDASRMRALELFPSLAEDLKLKKHHGRSDALLMGEYLRRKRSRDGDTF